MGSSPHILSASARRLLALSACAALTACASGQEEASRIAWDAAWSRLAPSRAAVAPIPSDVTLPEYIALALRRNRKVQAMAQRWKAGLERVPQARSLPDPHLTYGQFLEDVQTRTGPQRHLITAMQTIPWPGKLADRAGVALEEARAARMRFEAARLMVIDKVTQAYAAYYYLAREVAITADTLDLVTHYEAVARARLVAGQPAAHRDVIKAQVEMGRLEDRLNSLRDARRPQEQRLRSLLDLPPQTVLPWPRALPRWTLRRSPAEVKALLVRRSPVLAALDREVAARREGVSLAWQSYVPDLTVGMNWIEIGPAVNPQTLGSGRDAFAATFGVNLPIWVGRNRAAVREARARLAASELDRESTEDTLDARVSQGLYTYRDAQRKLRLYRDTLLPKAQESLEATSRAFEAGRTEFLNLLDAERILLEFNLAEERARADRLSALSELEMLIGTELRSASKEPR